MRNVINCFLITLVTSCFPFISFGENQNITSGISCNIASEWHSTNSVQQCQQYVCGKLSNFPVLPGINTNNMEKMALTCRQNNNVLLFNSKLYACESSSVSINAESCAALVNNHSAWHSL